MFGVFQTVWNGLQRQLITNNLQTIVKPLILVSWSFSFCTHLVGTWMNERNFGNYHSAETLSVGNRCARVTFQLQTSSGSVQSPRIAPHCTALPMGDFGLLSNVWRKGTSRPRAIDPSPLRPLPPFPCARRLDRVSCSKYKVVFVNMINVRYLVLAATLTFQHYFLNH